MATTITALYQDHAAARGALEDLVAAHVIKDDVDIITSESGGTYAGAEHAHDFSSTGEAVVPPGGLAFPEDEGAAFRNAPHGGQPDLSGHLSGGGVPADEARQMVDGIHRGEAVVMVTVDDGDAARAKSIVDSRHPTRSWSGGRP